jgi:hypothetical protein
MHALVEFASTGARQVIIGWITGTIPHPHL